jgi:hypothetical protein
MAKSNNIVKNVEFEEIKTQKMPIFKKAADFRSVYANNGNFSVTAFDFAIDFGQVVAVENGTPVVEQNIRVLMSPLHAKVFAIFLMQNVASYEKKFGELVLPKDAIHKHK